MCNAFRRKKNRENGCGPAYLARKNVSKGGEGVVESLVVNGLIKVLDEDVPNSALPQGRVTLRPHDAERPAFDHVKVHGVQGSLGYKQAKRERERRE